MHAGSSTWLGLVWKGRRITKLFEVLVERNIGCCMMLSTNQFAANFVSLDLSSCDQVIEKREQ